MESKKTLVMILMIAAALLAVGYLWFGGESDAQPHLADRAFYSDDDGKSWFVDAASQLPPFDHVGKQAVRAYVFTTDGGKTKWVGYLERFTAQAKAAVASARAGHGEPEEIVRRRLGGGVEVKRPGDAKWVSISDPQATAITQPKTPGGSTDGILALEP